MTLRWWLVVVLSTVLISALKTVNCHSIGSLQTNHLLVQDVEEYGWKLSIEVIGTHWLQEEYQKSVYVIATSSQVGNNSFNSVLIKKRNGVFETG